MPPESPLPREAGPRSINWLRWGAALLLIALLGFLVQQNLRPSLRSELRLATLVGRSQLSLPWLTDERPLWLSGFPSHRSLTLPLPLDAGIERARLTLPYQAALAENANGILMLRLNGELRAEKVLNPGERTGEITLPLLADDLTRRELRLSLSLLGDSGASPCGRERDQSAVVRVLPDARLDLVTSTAPESLYDRWALLARPLQLSLDGQRSGQALGDLLQFSVRLHQARQDNRLLDFPANSLAGLRLAEGDGVLLQASAGEALHASRGAIDWLPALFRSEQTRLLPLIGSAAEGEALRQLASLRGQRWPLSLTAFGLDDSLVTGSDEARWEVTFLRSDLPVGGRPAAIELSMATDGLLGDWQLATLLNGQLLGTAPLGAHHWIDLSHQPLAPRNRLELIARRVDRNRAPCTELPESYLQLSGQLTLQGLTAPLSPSGVAWQPTGVSGEQPALEQLVARLQEQVLLPMAVSPGLSEAALNSASALLAAVLPASSQLRMSAGWDDPALRTRDGRYPLAAAGNWPSGLQAMILDRYSAGQLPLSIERAPRWLLQRSALGAGSGDFDPYSVQAIDRELPTLAAMTEESAVLFFDGDPRDGQQISSFWLPEGTAAFSAAPELLDLIQPPSRLPPTLVPHGRSFQPNR